MKTNLDGLFKTDADLEKNGAWFEISEGTAFLLRPFKTSNPRVKAALAKHYKPYARQIENDAIDLGKQRDINTQLFMDVCLVDWRGVVIDGEEKKYDRETGLLLFKALPELFDTLWKHAQDYKNYKEDLGNF